MNTTRHWIVVLLIGGVMATPGGSQGDTAGATDVVALLRADIAAKPSRVLMAVEDALTVNERAACGIVKVAIEITRADDMLVGEIVFTALQRAPAMAATIVECALAAAPRSVEHINKAMRRALGEKAVSVAGKVTAGDSAAASRGAAPASETGGKESRAEPVKPVASQDGEPNDFFEFFGIGVGGIYLSTPGSTWFHACDPDDPCCSGELTPACLRP